jgi:hypothetical protein
VTAREWHSRWCLRWALLSVASAIWSLNVENGSALIILLALTFGCVARSAYHAKLSR